MIFTNPYKIKTLEAQSQSLRDKLTQCNHMATRQGALILSQKKQIKSLARENEKLAKLSQWIIEARARRDDQTEKTRQYVSIADDAFNLLNDPVFRSAFSDLIMDTETALFSTLPQETEKREELYNQSAAIRAVIPKIGYQIREAKAALRRREQAVEKIA